MTDNLSDALLDFKDGWCEPDMCRYEKCPFFHLSIYGEDDCYLCRTIEALDEIERGDYDDTRAPETAG